VPVRPPPLNALRAFEAASRTLSVKRAAQSLFVTPGAVSQLIKGLENYLGIRLFDRVPGGLHLTPAGREYASSIQHAFEVIDAATRSVGSRQGGKLVISSTPTFCFSWLVTRLKRFTALHPGIDVELRASKALVDFVRDDVDVAIRHGLGKYPGLHSVRVFGVELIPVASAALVKERNYPVGPADLLNWPLVHDAARGDWPMWFKAYGVAAGRTLRGPSYEESSLVIGACLAGEGAGLVPASLVKDHLRSRKLKRLLDLPWAKEFAYYLVCLQARSEEPQIRAFREWILELATD
jgi:LysR family transcriptional regulator, glycine cleavage system transcriptional activator